VSDLDTCRARFVDAAGGSLSPLEESGFEPLVPLATEMLIELARGISNATRVLAVGDIGPVPRLC
jgi:hypothetical protein